MKAILKPALIFPFVIGALLLGISGGANRLGDMTWMLAGAGMQHGVLMVGGFLGTLISLERAMVMKNKWWLLVVLFNGFSILVLVIPGWSFFAFYWQLTGSVGLVLMMYFQSLRHPKPYQYVMSIGAISWMIGNVALITSDFVPAAVPWWIGFLLFTIVGERLELSKFLPTPSYAKIILYILLALFFIGMVMPFHQSGNWVMGFAAIFIAFWLLHFDMAKIAAKKEKQFKYIGVGLKVGYVWLVLHGLTLCFLNSHPLFYDLYLHTFFLGFTFSMIWAHAPIIFPMILSIQEKPYHPVLWIGWVVFQLSLLGRLGAALVKLPDWRTLFGIINGWTIIAMFVMMAMIVLIKIMVNRWKRRSQQTRNKESINSDLGHMIPINEN